LRAVEELRSRSEAKARAASLFQPPQDRKGELSIESPQKIFVFMMAYDPTPDELVQWMSNPDEIDRSLKGTEHAHLIDPRAHQQRAGVLGSLGLVADSLRLLPKREEGNGAWTAASLLSSSKETSANTLNAGWNQYGMVSIGLKSKRLSRFDPFEEEVLSHGLFVLGIYTDASGTKITLKIQRPAAIDTMPASAGGLWVSLSNDKTTIRIIKIQGSMASISQELPVGPQILPIMPKER
jgi:hypothetical protein